VHRRPTETQRQPNDDPHDNRFSVNLPLERSDIQLGACRPQQWPQIGRRKVAINLRRAPREVNLLRLSDAVRPLCGQQAQRAGFPGILTRRMRPGDAGSAVAAGRDRAQN